MGEVIRDDSELCVECCCGNEQIRIRQSCASPIEFCVQCGRTVNDTVCQGKNDTALTQRVKGGLLRSGLLNFETAQDFVPGDDGEREPAMFGQIETYPVCDLWVLL